MSKQTQAPQQDCCGACVCLLTAYCSSGQPFEYYQRRYHLAPHVPTLCICFTHDTVLPLPCLSLVKGNMALAYELPEKITDVETQRTSQTGSQVLLGMYLSGVRLAQDLIDSLPATTRKRYLKRVEALGGRAPGRPVSTLVQSG